MNASLAPRDSKNRRYPRRLSKPQTDCFGLLFAHKCVAGAAIFGRMNSTRKPRSRSAWLYDGKPEFVDLQVASATPVEGGYVVALELTTGAIRLAATRHPAKYVSVWRHNVTRYGLPDVVRVFVSRPFLRYESVKRGLASMLVEHKDAESDEYRLKVDALTAKALETFSAAVG